MKMIDSKDETAVRLANDVWQNSAPESMLWDLAGKARLVMAEKILGVDPKQAVMLVEDVWNFAPRDTDLWLRADRCRSQMAEKLFARDPEEAYKIVQHVWQTNPPPESVVRSQTETIQSPVFAAPPRAVTPETFFSRLRSNIWFGNNTEQ
jgi:hypothetical protein